MPLTAEAVTEAVMAIKSGQSWPEDKGVDQGYCLSVSIIADDRTVTAHENGVSVKIPLPTVVQEKSAFENPDNFGITEWRKSGEGRDETRHPLVTWLTNLAVFGSQDQQESVLAIRDSMVNDVQVEKNQR